MKLKINLRGLGLNGTKYSSREYFSIRVSVSERLGIDLSDPERKLFIRIVEANVESCLQLELHSKVLRVLSWSEFYSGWVGECEAEAGFEGSGEAQQFWLLGFLHGNEVAAATELHRLANLFYWMKQPNTLSHCSYNCRRGTRHGES